MSSSAPLAVRQLCKTFFLYDKPIHRLWASLRLLRQPVREFQALVNVNFELAPGEVLGVVGRNGAGKSTLLQLICGTLRPSSGSVTVSGRIAALLELGAGFNMEFSGRENVHLAAAIIGLSAADTQAKFDEIVAFAELEAFIDQPVKTYSSGMFMRLAFSVATSLEPDVLIIDEALSVGDGVFARKSFDRILALKARGTTILFCSHALYQIEALCDRAIWLKDGQVEMLGRAASVVSAYQQFLTQSTVAQVAANTLAPGVTRAAGAPFISDVALVGSVADENGSADLPVFRSGVDAVDIAVQLVQVSNLPPPTVAVVITSAGGVQVCSFSTQIDGQPLEVGQSAVNLALPYIPLLKGDYEVDVFLLCERGLHVYEHVRQAARFRVTQSHLEVGVVHIPRIWSQHPSAVGPKIETH